RSPKRVATKSKRLKSCASAASRRRRRRKGGSRPKARSALTFTWAARSVCWSKSTVRRISSRAPMSFNNLSKTSPCTSPRPNRATWRAQAKNDPKNANKPEQVLDKIVEGRLNKFFEETVLLDQPFVKDPAKTIGDLLTEKIAAIKENITVRRFARYKMGEGIEKRGDDFGGEVAALL